MMWIASFSFQPVEMGEGMRMGIDGDIERNRKVKLSYFRSVWGSPRKLKNSLPGG
jgi:hypothetical protein